MIVGALNFFNLPNLLQPGVQKQRKSTKNKITENKPKENIFKKTTLQVILQNSVMWFLSPTVAGPPKDQWLYDRSMYGRMDNLLIYKPQK